jgi:hypothetical protein
MGFCVRISILSKEEQYLEAYEAFVDIKIVEKKLEEINHLLVTRTDYESDEYSQIIEDPDYTHRFELLRQLCWRY